MSWRERRLRGSGWPTCSVWSWPQSSHDLAAMSAYAERVATERFDHGFDISEAQMVFNSLEESMWKRVVS